MLEHIDEIYSNLSNAVLNVYDETDSDCLTVDIDKVNGSNYASIDLTYEDAIELNKTLTDWINSKRRVK